MEDAIEDDENAEIDDLMPPNLESFLPDPPCFWGESEKDWLAWQATDPICAELRKRSKIVGDRIRELDGILYHVKGKQVRIVVPSNKKHAVLKAMHEGSGHARSAATQSKRFRKSSGGKI